MGYGGGQHWSACEYQGNTYAELNGDGEEVDTSLLGDSIAAGNTRQVDVARLNETLLALESGPDDLLGKSVQELDQLRYRKEAVRNLPETGVGHG